MTKILEFPYERIRLEVIPFKEQVMGHQAKILKLPVKVSLEDLWFAYASAWMNLFKL